MGCNIPSQNLPLTNLFSAQRHFQPRSTVLQPPGESLQKGRKHGQEEKPGDDVLDQGAVPEICGGDDGQAAVLLRL